MKGIKSICACVFMLLVTASQADPAAVYEDFICQGFIPGLEGGQLGIVFTDQSHKVITYEGGVSNLSCHFDHDVDLPYATGAQGFGCGIKDPVTLVTTWTTESQMFASPGGTAMLKCRVPNDN